MLCPDKVDRLVEWNIEVLSGLLRSIVARREATNKQHRPVQGIVGKGNMVLDEVVEIITLPKCNVKNIKKQVDPSTIQLDTMVVGQLTNLVRQLASMYRR